MMLKQKKAIGLAVMAAATISIGFSAFAAEKEGAKVAAAPAKTAVCGSGAAADKTADCGSGAATDKTADVKVSLSGLKRDGDGNLYVVMEDGTKITVTMAQPDSLLDGDIGICFVASE